MSGAALNFWAAFTLLTGLIWLGRHIVLSRVNRVLPPLEAEADEDHSTPAEPLSVLVAAKDEEENIERCVRSLLWQAYSNLAVIAVNDRSTDRTGEILDRLAREDPRLTVVHIAELPAGWFGKSHAMHEAAKQANAGWLCFTDADCTMLSPHALTTAVRYARGRRCDFLSVLPVLETHSLLEQIIQPACAGILLIAFNPLNVNDPRRKAAYANGALMLMTSEVYKRIGGHEAVKCDLNEDIRMARIAKDMGLALCVVGNHDVYRVRMYSTFRQMWHGWSRIFCGSFRSRRRIIFTMLTVLLVGIQPWLTAMAGALLAAFAADPAPWRPVMWSGLAAVAVQLSVLIRYYRAAQTPAWLALTYPLAASLALGMLGHAISRLNGRAVTTWRGTSYRGEMMVRQPTTGRLAQPSRRLNPDGDSMAPVGHGAQRDRQGVGDVGRLG